MSSNVVYVDVLVLINIFVTYCLLISTKLILNLSSGKIRLIISSVLGGLFSLTILIDVQNPLLLNIVKLLMACVMVLICFYKKSLKQNIRNIIVFYIVNFIYAGLMFALWYFVTPPQMLFKNGVVYFNISAIFLALSTIVSYLAIKLFCYYFAKKPTAKQSCDMFLQVDGNKIMLKGFVDTGNRLVDAMTSLPIIICDFNKIKQIIPKEIQEDILGMRLQDITSPLWKKRLRIIPTNSVNGEGIIVAFKPDNCNIALHNDNVNMDVLIGLSKNPIMDGEFDAIVNNAVL